MKKEILYLIGGLFFVIAGMTGNGGLIISWQFQIAFGFLMMIYATFLSYQNNELKENKNIFFIGWGILPFVILLLNPFQSSNQIQPSDLNKESNFQNISTCKEGKNKAKQDIESGKLRYIFGGFGSRGNLAKNLEDKYEIEVIRLEGVVGMPNTCYNKIMYKEIQKKYGEDIFNKEFN